MPTISVQTIPSYPILIERGLLRKAGQTLLPLHPPCRAALLSDDTVFSLYGRAVMDSLEGAGYRPVRISLPAGETGKTWAVLGDLLERLFRRSPVPLLRVSAAADAHATGLSVSPSVRLAARAGDGGRRASQEPRIDPAAVELIALLYVEDPSGVPGLLPRGDP